MFMKLKFRYNSSQLPDVTVWYQPIKGQPSKLETADFFSMDQLQAIETGDAVSEDYPTKSKGVVLYHADNKELGLFIGTLDQMKQFDQDDNMAYLSFEYISVDYDPHTEKVS